MKKIILFLFLFVSAFTSFAQQDPQYTQYMFNPVIINPAYAGSREVLSSVLLYRHQWVGFEGAPITQTLSVHSPLRNKKVAIGLEMMHDQIGPKSSTALMGSYAYRIKLDKGKLSMGVRAGVYDFRYNWDKIDYKEDNDIISLSGRSRKIMPNFDFGLYYYTKDFFAGLAFSHIGNPRTIALDSLEDRTLSKLFTHATFTIGKAIQASDNVVVKPSVIVKTAGPGTFNADANLSVLLSQKLWLGVGIRTNATFMFLTELNITDNLRMGYSYDFTLSRLRTTNSGSHELFIGYDLSLFKTRTLSPRYF